MNLAYLTLEAPREGSAAYTHVHEIIAGLERRGWRVALYQPPYTALPVSPPLWKRLILLLCLQAKLWAHWQRGAALYIRGHYLAFPSCLIAWLLRIPVFHEINGAYEDVFVTHPQLRRARLPLIWMQRWQFRHATGLIAVTDDLRRWAAFESGGRRTAMISNGANTTLFRPGLPKPSGLPARYVVFFGGLTGWHGVPLMLEAASHAAWPPSVDLVIIGDGQYYKTIREAATKHPNIHALGRRPYAEIPAIVANAIAGLVPISNPGQRSSTGVMPLKLFETLACGIPAIVTDFPGQADLVREKNCGLVIADGDAAALAQSVHTLAQDHETAAAMGARGVKAITEEHSWDIRAGMTSDILQAWQETSET